MPGERTRSLRGIPAVDAILRREEVRALVETHGRAVVTEAVREAVALIRAGMADGSGGPDPLAELGPMLQRALGRRTESTLRRVLNATGVIVHTNLGRAPLSEEACARVLRAASGYATLEYDLAKGERGSRSSHIETRLSFLFPEQASLAVNNNAAAVFLALNELAFGREVIISRGELVEIGGSFRIPDVMEKSGARLREVGTTNRTRLADYEEAIGPATGLILKVHASNYRIVGFTQEAGVADLSALARRAGLPLMVDQGSGCLIDLSPAGVRDEPTVASLLGDGADLVTFSGDKILGGPQAGLVLGRRDLVDRMRRSPLYRALRLDKMTIAALEATLDAYVRGAQREEVPVLRMAFAGRDAIAPRAGRLAGALAARLAGRCDIGVQDGVSRVGGGAAPLEDLPTVVVTLRPSGPEARTVEAWEERIRTRPAAGAPPVVARIQDGALVIDLRTVDASDDDLLIEALAASF